VTLVAMGSLAPSGELTQMNASAQRWLDGLGFGSFSSL
jgi:hypothetical protein